MKPRDYLDNLLAHGKETFSLDEISEYTNRDKTSISPFLSQLKKKGEIISPAKGFYIIITPENRKIGCPQPHLFIDALMKFYNLPYYICLLSASVFYGAAHQQPQIFQVMTNKNIPNLTLGKVRISFIKRKNIEIIPTIIKPTTFINVKLSSPEATMMDLINYPLHSGGYNNIATIFEELAPEVDPIKLELLLEQQPHIVWKQRIGYMLEYLEIGNLANVCRRYINKQKRVDFILFNPYNKAKSKKDYPYNKNWKIIENEIIESDL